jgi:RHS repeat-associated protein
VVGYNNGVSTNHYVYDAEGQMTTFNNGAASYTYDAAGQRVRKDSSGSWTEYVYFNGQPLAEKNSDGSWSDYIFANGQRIVRADSYDRRIHTHGKTNSSGAWAAWSLPVAPFLVKSGDKLCWRQYQAGGAQGGISTGFSDGSSAGWIAKDQNGQYMNADTTNGNWLFRTVDLSSFAGKTLNSMWVDTDVSTPVGTTWDEWYGEIAFVRSDGTVFPIFARDNSVSLTYHYGGSILNPSGFVETANTTADSVVPWETTTYYHSDQIGSTRSTTSVAGWPIWSETYYPFGQDSSSVSSVNHYRFAGKIRDTETGNDYFGARYYTGSVSRFMSPDWSAKAEPVPYAKLGDPQTLNLYAYVGNNPLSRVDVDGHIGLGAGGFEDCNVRGDCNGGGQTKAQQVYNMITRDVAEGATVTVKSRGYKNDPGIKGMNGAQLKLEAWVVGDDSAAYNWKQTVTESVTSADGQPPNKPFTDGDPKTGLYWDPDQQKGAMNAAAKDGAKTLFYDNPHDYGGVSFKWHANLSLVGIGKDGKQTDLWKTTWGFAVDGKTGKTTLEDDGKLPGVTQ